MPWMSLVKWGYRLAIWQLPHKVCPAASAVLAVSDENLRRVSEESLLYMPTRSLPIFAGDLAAIHS